MSITHYPKGFIGWIGDLSVKWNKRIEQDATHITDLSELSAKLTNLPSLLTEWNKRNELGTVKLPGPPPTVGLVICYRNTGKICDNVRCRKDCHMADVCRAVTIIELACIDKNTILECLGRLTIVRLTATHIITRKSARFYLRFWEKYGKAYRLWLCGNCDLLCARRGGEEGKRGTEAETKRSGKQTDGTAKLAEVV